MKKEKNNITLYHRGFQATMRTDHQRVSQYQLNQIRGLAEISWKFPEIWEDAVTS